MTNWLCKNKKPGTVLSGSQHTNINEVKWDHQEPSFWTPACLPVLWAQACPFYPGRCLASTPSTQAPFPQAAEWIQGLPLSLKITVPLKRVLLSSVVQSTWSQGVIKIATVTNCRFLHSLTCLPHPSNNPGKHLKPSLCCSYLIRPSAFFF